ncbi:unnamed protein product [Caenorhabditis auriculariae]|uniref:Uncharacterized protein n=1 Tax=Caenorhabditis auriculariae TaxID=2777116 RepID=A0A8S1HL62_9PELO|nr:unnamed protein product [Caenorhabditis auriculariae]
MDGCKAFLVVWLRLLPPPSFVTLRFPRVFTLYKQGKSQGIAALCVYSKRPLGAIVGRRTFVGHGGRVDAKTTAKTPL